MKLDDVLRLMTLAGCSAEQIGVVAAGLIAAPQRSSNAERQARFRAKKKTGGVTDNVTRDVTSNVTSPSQVSPIDNHKPLPTHPDNSSLRSESSTPQNASIDLLGEIEKFPKAKRTEAVETIRLAGEGWNDLATAFRLPAIDSIKPGSTREKQTLARARDFKADHDLDAGSGFAKLFNLIRGSPYLRGEVNGFSCTFDWVIKPSNFIKIMEGNYEIRQQKGSGFGQRDYRRAG